MYDLVILGGGLSGSLLAWQLIQKQPTLNFLLIEKEKYLGGNHTWSFHESDLSVEEMNLVEPLISSSWSNYWVRFFSLKKKITISYHSVKSNNLHRIIAPALRDRLLLNETCKTFTTEPSGYKIKTNTRACQARVVIDARNIKTSHQPGTHAYQKFFGLEFEFSKPHNLFEPIIMDTDCAQRSDFRFFYVLPLTERTLLIEDTHYSLNPHIDENLYSEEILNYLYRLKEKENLSKCEYEIVRKEIGVLPIPLYSSDIQSSIFNSTIGYRGGFFHSVTGYSLPDAVRLANEISSLPFDSNFNKKVEMKILALRSKTQRKGSLLFALNRMLLLNTTEKDRVRIFERFYRLPLPTIQRFYANRLEFLDWIRLFLGRPPISIQKAVRSILSTGAQI
ncbi:MAG: lycopene beta-cyclase CrtY [Bacteriovoracia bacterium]